MVLTNDNSTILDIIYQTISNFPSTSNSLQLVGVPNNIEMGERGKHYFVWIISVHGCRCNKFSRGGKKTRWRFYDSNSFLLYFFLFFAVVFQCTSMISDFFLEESKQLIWGWTSWIRSLQMSWWILKNSYQK